MWETIKSDFLIRTILVIIIGMLGFGFAFNVISGTAISGMEHGGNGGYSLNHTFIYIFTIFIKVLLITVIILAVAAVIRYSKGQLKSITGNSSLVDFIEADPVVKTILIVLLTLLAVVVFYAVYRSVFGYNMGYHIQHFNYAAMYSSFSLSLSSILVFLVKLLFVISVIGFLAGIGMYFLQVDAKKRIIISKLFNDQKVDIATCQK
ncbi:MAG: hypothetical protein ACOZCL_13475 [Bacillota bacterium]